jgi:hypothetical protein
MPKGNNPVRYTDPSGHSPVCIGAVIDGVCQLWSGLIGANAAHVFEGMTAIDRYNSSATSASLLFSIHFFFPENESF